MNDRMTEQIQSVVDIFGALEREGYFGSVEIKMESGKVVLVRATRSFKLNNIPINFRGSSRGERNEYSSRS